MTPAQLQALHLIATNAHLLPLGQRIIGMNAKALRLAGMIYEAPSRKTAYSLTPAGRAALAAA